MKRSDFLKTSGLSLSALGLLGLSACAKKTDTNGPETNAMNPSINMTTSNLVRGIQLYTVRGLLENDFFGTLKTLKNVGITDLEFAGYYNKPLDEISSFCSDIGLNVPSSHFQYSLFFDNPEKILEDAKTMGHRYIVLPWLPEDMRTKAVFDNVISVLNELGPIVTDAGMKLCYHNHDFEFMADDGEATTFDRLLNETNPEHVFFELDLFWTVHAGYSPIELLTANPDRYLLCHVKDRKASDGSMVSVGSGDINFGEIFKAHHFDYHFIEHDNPEDAMMSVQRSADYLKSTLNFS